MVHTWFTGVLQVACLWLTRRLFLLSINWNDCLRTPQEIVAAWQEAIDRLLERGVKGRILLGNLVGVADDVSELGLKRTRSQSTVGGTCIARDRATAGGLHVSAQVCFTYGAPRPLHQPLHQPFHQPFHQSLHQPLYRPRPLRRYSPPTHLDLDAYFSTNYVFVGCRPWDRV